LTGAIDDKLAELSPYTRILVATKNLAKNVQELKELPSKLDEAGKTVGEQLEALNNQLTKLQPKLDQMKLQDQDKIVDRLFARATRLQRTCEDLSKKTDDCEKQRKSFVALMCWGGSQADKSKCDADSHKEFNCQKYGFQSQ
jgi:ABC-type phosphate transport system auxiliary subunit